MMFRSPTADDLQPASLQLRRVLHVLLTMQTLRSSGVNTELLSNPTLYTCAWHPRLIKHGLNTAQWMVAVFHMLQTSKLPDVLTGLLIKLYTPESCFLPDPGVWRLYSSTCTSSLQSTSCCSVSVQPARHATCLYRPKAAGQTSCPKNGGANASVQLPGTAGQSVLPKEWSSQRTCYQNLQASKAIHLLMMRPALAASLRAASS